ncbi:hypothetical protein ACFQ0D_29825, partial [Micromonospora zhanjiangensis]
MVHSPHVSRPATYGTPKPAVPSGRRSLLSRPVLAAVVLFGVGLFVLGLAPDGPGPARISSGPSAALYRALADHGPGS